MFRVTDQGLWRGQVEHLPRGMTGGHRLVQGSAAPRAGLREMIDRGIGAFRFGSTFCQDGLSGHRASCLTVHANC